EQLLGRLHHRDADPGASHDLGDPRAHQPAADHPDRADVRGVHHVSPRSGIAESIGTGRTGVVPVSPQTFQGSKDSSSDGGRGGLGGGRCERRRSTANAPSSTARTAITTGIDREPDAPDPPLDEDGACPTAKYPGAPTDAWTLCCAIASSLSSAVHERPSSDRRTVFVYPVPWNNRG